MTEPTLFERFRSAFRAFADEPTADPSAAGPYAFLDSVFRHRSTRGRHSLADWEGSFQELPILRAVLSRKARLVAETRIHLDRIPRQTPKSDRRAILAALESADGIGDRRSAVHALRRERRLEPVVSHPLLDLLRTGNGYHTGRQLAYLTSVGLDLTGELPWILDRNVYGTPSMAFPVPASWVDELPTPRRANYTFRLGGSLLEVPRADVVWFRDPDPANPYGRASGIAMTLGHELEADEAAAEHIANHFLTGGRPEVIISGGPGLYQNGTQDLERRWRQKARRRMPFFLRSKSESSRIGVHQVGWSPEQIQTPALRKLLRDLVTQTNGMPPEILGILENGSNRSTIDAALTLFCRLSVRPRVEDMIDVYAQQILSQYPGSDRAVLSYDNPVPTDQDFRLKAFRAQPHAPTVSEWRELQGLPYVDGTDVHMVKGKPHHRLDAIPLDEIPLRRDADYTPISEATL